MLNQGFHFSPLTEQGTYSSKPNLGVPVWCLKLGGMNIAQKNYTALADDGKSLRQEITG